MTKKPSLINSIRAKLISAVAMLLVAVIMVVSSTYAWFTLSTAPEVTGITTSIGANGALEMALVPPSGDLEGITTSTTTLSTDAANLTWGNLVVLNYINSSNNKNHYGLDQITLYPSALNLTEADPTILGSSMLKVPSYGADGRIQDLVANTVTGVYDPTKDLFPVSGDFGVRAIGVASGMTERQLSYRNAMAAAANAMTGVKTAAKKSLTEKGPALANIAVGKAMGSPTYTQTDVSNLKGIVNDLLGYKDENGAEHIGSLELLEQAYLQYILAFAASGTVQTFDADDTIWKTVKAAVDSEDADLVTIYSSLPSSVKDILPQAIKDGIEAYQKSIANVEEADDALDTLASDTQITWDDISKPLTLLANPDAMLVNDIPATDLKKQATDENGNPMFDEDDEPVSNMDKLASSVMKDGIIVTMTSGGGVYADIADHCGDYNVDIVIDKLSYGTMSVPDVPATMATKSQTWVWKDDVEDANKIDSNKGNATYGSYQPMTPYLTQVNTAVTGKAPTSSGGNEMPLTEFYGYIIDLAFRTNAAASNLLLQTTPIDRIYGEDNTNENTQGQGSTMTFTISEDLKLEDAKYLMSCFRVVFFVPDATSNKILATAKLDTANATVEDDVITANLYLYDEATSTLVTDKSAAVITALAQNEAQKVSALVYLDGAAIENKHVAATTAQSLSGSLNLQFASSANLVPMEYAGLHQPGEGGDDAGDAGATNEYTVTVPANGGVTGNAKATAGQDYTFTVVNGCTLSKVTVGGTELAIDDLTNNNGTYTIPAAKVTGAIVIEVTGTPTP